MLRNTFLALGIMALSSGPALATPITVDQILYAPAGADALWLSGSVDMTLSGNILTITLTNTSADAAGIGSGILLTGIGFTLPGSVQIQSGTVSMTAGSTAIGFDPSGNLSKEWGYDNDPLDSGFFGAVGGYDTVISTLQSMASTQFSSGSIGQPGNLGGPEFGLASVYESDTGGLPAVKSSIMITLTLSGTDPNLLSTIEAGKVGLSFGSPTAVPEPASLTLLLCGLAGVGVAAFRKRRL